MQHEPGLVSGKGGNTLCNPPIDNFSAHVPDAEILLQEQLRQIRSQITPIVVGNAVAGAVSIYLLWDVVSHWLLG